MDTHFSIESLTKEKINRLQAEGMARQMYQPDGAEESQRSSIFRRFFKRISRHSSSKKDYLPEGKPDALGLENFHQLK